MPNVVRFALDSARDLYVPGAGTFIDGILDIDANNLAAVSRARFRVQPYRAVEIGIVDSATPPPALPPPSVPPAPNSDPYTQYLLPSELPAAMTTVAGGDNAFTTAQKAAALIVRGSAPPLHLGPPRVQDTAWVQDFTGGTVTGAQSYTLADATDTVYGTPLVVTTAGDNVIVNASKTGLAAVNFTGKYLRVLVEVDQTVNLNRLSFLLGTGGFANYFSLNAQFGASVSTSSLQMIQPGSPQWVTLGWAEAQTVGTPDIANINALRVQVRDVGGGKRVTLKVYKTNHAKAPAEAFPKGVLTWFCDDGYLSSRTVVAPYLARYGHVATMLPIVDRIGTGAPWCDLQHLRDLRDIYGWEVGGHALTQAHHDNRFTTLSQADLEADFAGNRAWLMANGFNAEVSAYPGGSHSPAIKAVARRYWSAQRGVVSATKETFPPADQMIIRAYPADMTTGGPTLADIKTAIDAAVANKQWLGIVLHDQVATPAANSSQWPIASFQQLADYAAASGIAVRTYGDVLREHRV